MAFLAARQLYPIQLEEAVVDLDELNNILNNSHLSSYFLSLARQVRLSFIDVPF